MYNTIGMALESMNALFALKKSVHVPIDVILIPLTIYSELWLRGVGIFYGTIR